MPGRGIHLAIDRDEAKRVFGFRDENDRLQFLHEELEEKLLGTPRGCETDKAWEAIHDCLTIDPGDPADGAPPLEQTVLGGRPLYGGEDHYLLLVRPDLVPIIAAGLESIDRVELRRRYDSLATGADEGKHGEEHFEYVWSRFERLREFYRRAAAEGHAVLFSADR